MEDETGGGERGHRTPSFISFNGWVGWDRKMETMMDSMTASFEDDDKDQDWM